MIEVMKNIYRMDISFTDHTLSGINPYLIKGSAGEQNLLIETALNTDACCQQLLGQMEVLAVYPDNTDIIVSHMHVDHSGLIGRLKTDSNRVYAEARDAVYIKNYQKPVEQWGWLAENIIWTGTPPEDALPLAEHVAAKYHPQPAVDLTILELGDRLSYGGYQLEVIDLAGHAAAHIGLWCEQERILFSGDHLLMGHNPNVTAWNLEADFLYQYQQNLLKLAAMKIRYLFPAHGDKIEHVELLAEQYLARIEQKQQRIKRIVTEQKELLTAYQVAGKMYSEERFGYLKPLTKWFVCSDILAYLQHLSFCGQIQLEQIENVCYYRNIN